VDLRSLDDRFLPVAATRARRAARVLERAGTRGRGVADAVMRVLRERPVISGVLLLAIVGAIVATAVTEHRPTSTSTTRSVRFADVGPSAGVRAEDYVAATHRRLDRLSAGDGRETYAVVDFSGYVTVATAGQAVNGMGVFRAYFRAVVPGVQTQPHTALVRSMSEVASSIASTATVERSAAESFQKLAGAIPTRTSIEKQVRDTYARQAQIAAVEGRALTPTCACVYALVVHGTVADLKALARRPGVRVVDPAPAGIPLEGLAVVPLLPEITGAMPVPGRPVPPH
jgi:hypothetical protein